MVERSWWIYFVGCRRGEVYTGIATDVARRFAEHQAGGARAARFLRGRGPLKLIDAFHVGPHTCALRLEARVKKLPRQRKLAMLAEHAELVRNLEALRTEPSQVAPE